MNSEDDANLNWATSIDTVAATSLGIEGRALFDVGTSQEPGTSSAPTPTAMREGRGAAPLSICLIGSITNMFEWYPLACDDSPTSQASGAITFGGASLGPQDTSRAPQPPGILHATRKDGALANSQDELDELEEEIDFHEKVDGESCPVERFLKMRTDKNF